MTTSITRRFPPLVTPVGVYAGDSLRLQYEFKNAGVGVDVSAWTFTASWRRTLDAPKVLDFTVDDTDAATGVIVLTMTPDQTQQMGGSGYFDLQGVGSGVRTFLSGRTEWKQDVTRD